MMSRKHAGLMVFTVLTMLCGIPGSVFAFGGEGGSSGLFGDLKTYGLTKEDLRREKPRAETWQHQEAADTGKLESETDASSSTETGGVKDRTIDPWP